MRDSVHGICRSCAAMCPIVIDREDGRPVRIIGDKHNPVYWLSLIHISEPTRPY